MTEAKPHPDTPELSILILCRDEEKAIAHCIGEALGFLKRRDIAGEVVVVDNGSRDRSAALARAAGARVVHESRPGYGNAIIAGVEAATGRDAILGDGDGEHDLGALDAFWDELREGHDFVFGNRFAGGIDPEAMSFLRRRIGNPLLSGVGKLLTGAPLGDFHCGLRGFRVEAARALALQCPGMECASEMIVKAVSAGGRIAEVPVTQRSALDPERISRLRVFHDGWRHLRLLLLLSPRWLFLIPGCVLLAASLPLVLAPVLHPVESGGRFGVYTMLVGAALMICGAQAVGFHLFARVRCEAIGLVEERLSVLVRERRVLEWILAAGFALALAGAAGSVWSLFAWAGGVDVEARLRLSIGAVALLVVGAQAMFGAFLLSLLSMPSTRQ